MVKEAREARCAPCVGSSPTVVHRMYMGSGDPGEGRQRAGQGRGRAVFSKVLFGRESCRTRSSPGGQGNSRQEEQHVQGMRVLLRHCKALLSVAGAQGMCGGGQERRTQGRQGQLVKEPHTPFHQRWGFSCRPQGVPEGFVGEGSNQMCGLERSLWLHCGREWRGGRETGKKAVDRVRRR